MIAATLESRLLSVGQEESAEADRPFILSRGSGWYVRSGRVDVFRVPVRRGRPAGARSHLFRVEHGQVFFGISGERAERPIGLLAVGTHGTRLVRVPDVEWRSLVADPELAEPLRHVLDGWIALLCRSIAGEVPPADCVDLRVDAPLPEAARRIRPVHGVSWIRHEAGTSLLLGRDGLVVDSGTLTPLSRHAWLQLSPNARLRVEDTQSILGREELWSGLGQLHELALDCATQMAEEAVRIERERLRQKAAADRRAFSHALSALAATIERDDARVRHQLTAVGDETASGADDVLFRACQRVGAYLAIEMRPGPRDHGTSRTGDPLTGIAQASRVRTRQVLLREGWWRQDGGAFLAHLEPDKRPVALIPDGPAAYLLVDPTDRSERRVTEEQAASIDPRAFSFYRPFEESAIGIASLLRFAIRGCGRDVATVAWVSTAAGVLSLGVPIATGVLFNDVIPGADRSALIQVTVALIAIAVASAAFEVTRSIALVRIRGKMEQATQPAVWDRLLSLPMPFFRPYTAGDLATRAMGIDAIREVLAGQALTAMIGAVLALFQLGLLVHYSPSLARWATGIIVLAVALTVIGSRLQMRHERSVALAQSKLAGSVLQILTSIAKLRGAGAEPQAFSLWARGFSRQRRLQFKARTVGDAVAAANAALPTVAFVLLYALAFSRLGSGGTLRTGDFIAFMAAFAACLSGTLGASAALLGTLRVIPLYEQAKPILTTPPEVDQGKQHPGVLTGAIEAHRLRFRYQPGSPLVLRDVSLTIRAGEFVALVGGSGSGKSTMLRLLLGFETPEGGSIYYDGHDLARLDRQALRRQVGVVLQNGRLMAGDIFSNIVGSSLATVDDAWEAARMAGLADDIRAMPMGMHTVISEGAGTLSGGQRQRLLIARALVQKPRILFFDEATSALDNRTQEVVTASLEHLQVTRVVIAHRLSTVLRADRIHVVDRGRIAESGSYDELMAAGGLFRELARRQLA